MSNLPLPWIAAGVGFCYLLQSGALTLRGVGIGAAALVSGGLLLLYKFQEHLLYQPRIFPQHLTPKDNPVGMRSPSEHGLPFEDVYINTADGMKLHAWFLRPEDKIQRLQRATLLFFQENAGNMGMRMDSLRMLYASLNVNICILSYRGYGESTGLPSEDGIYIDSEATLQWLLARDDIDTSRIVLMGRSLGGAVAIDLASKHEASSSGESALPGVVAGLILENTFCSISSMVDVVFPYLTFAKRLILRMKWDSLTKIATIRKPIIFISGTQDEIVPSSQMLALHAAAVSSPSKDLLLVADGHHNDTWMRGGAEYVGRLRRFLDTHAKPGAAPQPASRNQTRAAL